MSTCPARAHARCQPASSGTRAPGGPGLFYTARLLQPLECKTCIRPPISEYLASTYGALTVCKALCILVRGVETQYPPFAEEKTEASSGEETFPELVRSPFVAGSQASCLVTRGARRPGQLCAGAINVNPGSSRALSAHHIHRQSAAMPTSRAHLEKFKKLGAVSSARPPRLPFPSRPL